MYSCTRQKPREQTSSISRQKVDPASAPEAEGLEVEKFLRCAGASLEMHRQWLAGPFVECSLEGTP